MEKGKTTLVLALLTLLLGILIILYIPNPKLTGFAIIEQDIEFDQGETLISVISGNFIYPITRENIIFFREHVNVPMDYELKKIGNDFYVYALLMEKVPGNYSLVVRGAEYWKGIHLTTEDIVKNFTITENTADFYINPGVIVTDSNFFIDVRNLKVQKIDVFIKNSESFITQENNLELTSGQIKRVHFNINTNESTFETVEISSSNTVYFVPVFFDSDLEIPTNGENGNETDPEEAGFKFTPEIVNVSLSTNSDSKRIVYLINSGDSIEDISLSVSESLEEYVEVYPEEISGINKDSSVKVDINIFSGDSSGLFNGYISATSGNFTEKLHLSLHFIEEYMPPNDTTLNGDGTLPFCHELGSGTGRVCLQDERCSIETLSARGVGGLTTVNCCLGICEKVKRGSTAGQFIGWGMLVLVVVFLIWFFIRHKRARPSVDLLKIAKGKNRK